MIMKRETFDFEVSWRDFFVLYPSLMLIIQLKFTLFSIFDIYSIYFILIFLHYVIFDLI